MPQGGIDDKPLARIQFASALRLAVAAGHATPSVLREAAGFVAADQGADGSWPLDSSQSLGSPTTYGAVLATAAAVNVLRAAGRTDLQPAIAKGDAWLRAVQPSRPCSTRPACCSACSARATKPPSGSAHRRSPSSAKASHKTAAGVLRHLGAAGIRHGARRARPRGAARADAGSAIARGRAYLVAQQLDDGSWPETTRPANQESYAQRISTTGWALLALLAAHH